MQAKVHHVRDPQQHKGLFFVGRNSLIALTNETSGK